MLQGYALKESRGNDDGMAVMDTNNATPRLATLYLDNGVAVSVALFLQHRTRHNGAETPIDLIDEAGQALRCRTLNGQALIVDKDRISAVAVSIDPHDEFGFHLPIRGVITVAGGHRFEGDILSDGAADHALHHVLDTSEPWMIERFDGRVVWGRKNRVLAVQET
jgi:hypothetical protein